MLLTCLVWDGDYLHLFTPSSWGVLNVEQGKYFVASVFFQYVGHKSIVINVAPRLNSAYRRLNPRKPRTAPVIRLVKDFDL